MPLLRATPLAAWERDGLKAALTKAGLLADDVAEPDRLFWRFERHDDMPVGFGGLEIHGTDALLRSIVILPPLRRRGSGRAVVGALEQEAQRHGCGAIYLLTMSEADFFARLGYAACARDKVPDAIRSSRQFAALCPETAAVMVKRMG
jgi:N-acetylglutamate synthase-like GNAT family acetyltransferase